MERRNDRKIAWNVTIVLLEIAWFCCVEFFSSSSRWTGEVFISDEFNVLAINWGPLEIVFEVLRCYIFSTSWIFITRIGFVLLMEQMFWIIGTWFSIYPCSEMTLLHRPRKILTCSVPATSVLARCSSVWPILFQGVVQLRQNFKCLAKLSMSSAIDWIFWKLCLVC